MSNRPPIFWNSALRGLHADRIAVPAGFVVARNRITAFAGFRKTPLVVAGTLEAPLLDGALCAVEIRKS